MKKFYCNGKIVYMNNDHNSISAKFVLKELGIASEFDNVCLALEQDQDMLEVYGPDFEEAAVEPDACCEPVEKAIDDLDEFFVDMFGDEDYDYYALPNGRSAPYGLTGVEVAAMPAEATLHSVSLYRVGGVMELKKGLHKPDQLLIAVERDLVFGTRKKAVEAYNALFGDLYGTV